MNNRYDNGYGFDDGGYGTGPTNGGRAGSDNQQGGAPRNPSQPNGLGHPQLTGGSQNFGGGRTGGFDQPGSAIRPSGSDQVGGYGQISGLGNPQNSLGGGSGYFDFRNDQFNGGQSGQLDSGANLSRQGSGTATPVNTKPNLRVCLIGRCGAGKTMFFNLLLNLIYGKRVTDERIVGITQLVELISGPREQPIRVKIDATIETFKDKQSESLDKTSLKQTKKVNKYKIDLPFFSITFIDTPGLESKNDIQDVAKSIVSFGVPHVIFYVHRDDDLREDPIFKSIYDEFGSMLIKDFEKNFYVVFTRAKDRNRLASANFLRKYGFPVDNKFCFECSAFTPIPEIKRKYTKQDEYNQMIKQIETIWNQNKIEYDMLSGELQKIIPKVKVAKLDTQSNLTGPSTDGFFRAYTQGELDNVKIPYAEQNEAYENIVSQSDACINFIFQYCSQENSTKRTELDNKVYQCMVNIVSNLPKIKDLAKDDYFVASIDQRIFELDRERALEDRSKKTFKDIFGQYKTRYIDLRRQGVNHLQTKTTDQTNTNIIIKQNKVNLRSGEEIRRFDGGYIRPKNAKIEEFVKPTKNSERILKQQNLYVNPQVRYLNFFEN